MASVERAEVYFGPERPFVYGDAGNTGPYAYWGDCKPIDPRCHVMGGSSPMEEKVVQGATNATLTDRVNIAVSELHRRVIAAESYNAEETKRLRQKADALTAMNDNQCETIVMLRKELQTLKKYNGTKERAAAWDAVWQQLQGGNGYRTDLDVSCGTNTTVKQIAELQRKARAFDQMMEIAK